MKNKYYQQSKLKKELLLKRQQRIKVLTWKLTVERKREIQELGYRVEPYLYSIRTKTFQNIRSINSTLLKDLHYMKKRGKDIETRTLKREEKELLDEYGIKYYPVKYKIYLQN